MLIRVAACLQLNNSVMLGFRHSLLFIEAWRQGAVKRDEVTDELIEGVLLLTGLQLLTLLLTQLPLVHRHTRSQLTCTHPGRS